MACEIHPTAIVEEGVKLGENVKIGAFSIVEKDVTLGDNTIVMSHCVLKGHLITGSNNQFYSFCSIGEKPQDLTYKNEPTQVIIGDNNIFREYVSIHRGTLKEDGKTIIKNNCLLMAHVHVGHDVTVGNNVVVANSVNFAGHVKVGDRVIIGGGTNVSQFVTLGRGSYLGGASAIDRDIPIFCTAYGNRVKLKGINIIGLRRQGYSKQEITEVVDFYRTMEASAFSPRSFVENKEFMEEYKENQIIKEMAEGIRKSEIGIAPFVA